ncbi:MAG: GTPase [Candidatus Pacearchaeota archaeon]
MGYWPIVLNVLKNSDVIVLIADARVPEMTRNREIIRKATIMNKKVVLVFNKIDLVCDEEIALLKKKYPESFFVTNKNKKSVTKLRDYLEELAEKNSRVSLRVGIVGYPNVGKSTIINMIIPEAKLKVSNISGTTKKTEWIRFGRLRFMDSPGVIPVEDSADVVGIVSAKDPNKMKNPEKVADKIIGFLNNKNRKILENFYGAKADNNYDFMREIGKKKKFLLRGGEIDERRTAIKIIEDWQNGKISLR